MTKSQRESYTEVLMILNNMDPNFKSKIPLKLIDFFEENSLENYESNIDVNIPFKEQKIKNRTLALLALLNLNYWCETEAEKQKLIMQYQENEREYYQRSFSNSKCEKSDEIMENAVQNVDEEKAIVECKCSIFDTIINKIKRLFGKK